MNIQLKKLDAVSAEITVDLVKADYEEKVNKAIKDYAKRAQMPGFRPGKVPMSLIQKRVGTSFKAEEVEKMASNELYKYLTENKVDILGSPLQSENQKELDIEKDDFTFVFDVALRPEFDATLTEKDKIVYYDIKAGDKEVDEQVSRLCQQAAHPENAEEYQDGDVVRGTLTELENGAPKAEGLVVENASLMPRYFKEEDAKKLFEGAKVGSQITFNPWNANKENEGEMASLLKIDKSEVVNHTGDFLLEITEFSRMVPAKLDQELFDLYYKDSNIKTEEDFRARIKQDMEQQMAADSDYRFLLDVREYLAKKVGKLQFAEKFLKRIMKANNPKMEDKAIDENFEKSIEELQWQMERDQLVKQTEIKVTDEELHQTAVQAARFQFAQYGINNIPDQYLENYAKDMLTKEEQRANLMERAIETKLSSALKNVVKLNRKSVTLEEFNKLFEK